MYAPSTASADDYERPVEGIRLTGDWESITIEWINYSANCCPEGFSFHIEVAKKGNETEEGVINVYASDEDGMCDCICPYDLKGVFSDITPGLYTLHFFKNNRHKADLLAYLGNWINFEYIFPNEDEPADTRRMASEVKDLGCRKGSMSNTPRASVPGFVWTVKYENKVISVQWTYVGGNCNTPGFTSWIASEDSKTLDFFIEEKEIPGWPLASCVCPYTINATYPPYSPGEYTLRFHQGGEIYTVTAHLSEGFEACYTAAELVSAMTIEDNGDPIRKLNGDVLRFEAPGEFNAELIDANGITILNISATDSTEISIAGLSGGIYIARMIKSNGETETLRFMK